MDRTFEADTFATPKYLLSPSFIFFLYDALVLFRVITFLLAEFRNKLSLNKRDMSAHTELQSIHFWPT
jgi:hypothetical protein